jgi:endonuclease/exonuclease/phosphatase family metal-dependent hydrolase
VTPDWERMPELTLVTFNAHAGLRPRPFSLPRPWGSSRRPGPGPFDLTGVLIGFDADVIVVQESFRPDQGPSALDAAAEQLGFEVHEVAFGRGVVDPWPHLVRDRGTGDKGLTVLSRFGVRARADVPIARVLGDPALHRRALHLELDVSGEPLDLIALHFTSRLPYGPLFQLGQLRSRLPHPGRRAVVAGDFNFWGPPIETLLDGWRRAVRGRTWPAHRPHSQIDHVLVRDDVEVLAAEVLHDVGSDHRPVRVRLGF